jgi:hypothetical protein
MWLDTSGTPALVFRSGNQAPGTPSGVAFSQFNAFDGGFRLNNDGQIAFLGNLTGTGVDSTNNRGIFSYDAGNLALVARSGDPVHGMPGVNFAFLNLPVLNSSSQMAFRSGLAGSGVNSSSDQAIWLGNAGDLELVVRSGSQAPDLPTGATFSGFDDDLALNDAGLTAFAAFTDGVDPEHVTAGVWSEGSGNLALVARVGTQPPGAPSGTTFDGFHEGVVLNNAGKIAFHANVRGEGIDPSNGAQGIWSDVSSSLQVVVFEQMQAPGTPGGTTFRGVGRPLLNDAGQVAFRASLFGTLVDNTNNEGIWATNRSGELQLILRTGGLLEVAPGDSRTIRFLSLVADSGNSDGRPSGFNNLGQLAFWAEFTDGSQGIFISNLVAVPEPQSLLLVVLAVSAFNLPSRAARARSRFPVLERRRG